MKQQGEFAQRLLYMYEIVKENKNFRAGEMAQRLRALTALPEGLSAIPSNHMVAHSHL